MSNDDVHGTHSSQGSDWKNVWESFARLAATRENRVAIVPGAEHLMLQNSPWTQPDSALELPISSTAMRLDQVAGAVAEIERAAAALRRSEPALELGVAKSVSRTEARKYRSVWILIGALWISATLVVATATGAILLLLG